jgi:hypothetical protein
MDIPGLFSPNRNKHKIVAKLFSGSVDTEEAALAIL